MSSLARRSMRTTAAAAGIAALGVGFAGHAFAAPEAPALPEADALPGLPAAPDAEGFEALMLSETPSVGEAPSFDEMSLPPLFNFEMPTVSTNTADLPGAPTMPEAPDVTGAPVLEAPEAPGMTEAPDLGEGPDASALEGIVNYDGEFSEVGGPSPDPASFADNNSVGAMPSLDTAAMFMEMAEKAAAGESLTEGNSIG